MTSEESLGPVPLRKDRTTVLGYPRGDLLTVLIGMPILGLLLGIALPPLARWLSDLPVLPRRDGIALVGSLDRPWHTAIAVGVGLVVGLLLAGTDYDETLKLTLTDQELVADLHERKRSIERARVSAVFLDGKELVVLDESSREFTRGVHKTAASPLAKALRSHGYPWRDADPHAALFHRWIPGVPGLPAEAHAVLAARKAALKNKAAEDVRDLAETMQGLGYVVRDEGKDQYWRALADEATATDETDERRGAD
ncbi:YqeB family protein [Streptomyces sp. NPDC054871]